MRRTGWPPGLLQDDSRPLSRWFASRIDARRVVREVANTITQERLMTLQEAFDTIVRGIRAQGEPSTLIGESAFDGTGLVCMYRQRRTLPDGTTRILKCGIGMLIKDEDYRPELEGKNVSTLVAEGLWAGGPFSSAFLQGMQDAHDDAAIAMDGNNEWFMDNFLDRARNVATKYGLSDEATR